MRGFPEIMGLEESVGYLRTRIGDLAPLAETLRSWTRDSYRARYAEIVAARKLPKGATLYGTKKLAFSRASLDVFADAMVAEVHANDEAYASARPGGPQSGA